MDVESASCIQPVSMKCCAAALVRAGASGRPTTDGANQGRCEPSSAFYVPPSSAHSASGSRRALRLLLVPWHLTAYCVRACGTHFL
jgi:hypothetical protein